MNLNDFLERIPLFNKVTSVLVCESDFNGLKAAVITRKGQDLVVAHETRSDNPDFSAAVAEVVSQVRVQGWAGKHAALLSPAVMMALLELPIAAKNKLAPKQLADQIQYELEPLINQHLGSLTIGRLLVLQGLLTDEQVEDILSHQAELNNAQSNNYISSSSVHKRFGEVADSLGYISLARIKSYLDRQACFKTSSEDIQCGWSAQGLALGEDIPRNMHHWLTSAINKTLLRQWQAAFTAQDIKLSAIYPLVGSAASLLNTQSKLDSHQLLIEVTPSSVVGIYLVGDKVHGLHVLPNSAQSTLNNIAETFHVLEQENLLNIVLADSASANQAEAIKLSNSVERVINRPAMALQNDALNQTGHTTLGMLGVARHIMRMKGASLIAGVSVQEPQPPLLQNVAVRAVLALLTLLLTVGIVESVQKVRESLISSENDELQVEVDRIKAEEAKIQAKIDEVKKLKEQIKTLNNNNKSVIDMTELLTTTLPKRNEMVSSLLVNLTKLVPNDLVMNHFSEDPQAGFHISAWSLTDKSANLFIKNLQTAVNPLGYQIRDIDISQSIGRLGLMGYKVEFNATALSEEEWKALRESIANEELAQEAEINQDQQVSEQALSANENISVSGAAVDVAVSASQTYVGEASPTSTAVEKP